MKSDSRKLQWVILFGCSAALFLSLGVSQRAQRVQKLPAPTGHINDFAGVVNEKTRQQLENILAAVKQKTGIEFDIATVESAGGQDVSDFSLQLAREWNVGTRNNAKKSLLLVLAINEKTSFTRFSRSVQGDLPEGVLGEMGQRMRGPFEAGQFSEGLKAGVDHFVAALANKLGLNAEDLTTPGKTVVAAVESNAKPVETNKPADSVTPTDTTISTPEKPTEPVRASRPLRTRETSSAKTNRPYIVDDEAEQEEVELTLTLPAEARVTKLKAFLDSRPESKWRPRATELLVSSRAALGDEKLKKGDSTGGVEQLLQAIADAPANASERLFSGVISQVPLNLYLRGETTAAMKAAHEIEAKFGSDAKRLVALSGFYLATEQGGEAIRLATKAVELAPDSAEAHRGLASAFHISLRLDEAAREFKRAMELDPNSKPARRGFADLSRALGKPEDALAIYRQQLEADASDKAARTGLILSLLDLNRIDEAKTELETAIKSDPRNLNLLAGAAYWFAAHNDPETALSLGQKAVEIEPRYTWSQVAVARALLAQRKPLEAERAIRFARQYGKFPTLDYELASTLMAAALYEEAAEVLSQSFSFKDGQIETRLGGQAVVRGEDFVALLAPERLASIFQPAAADTQTEAKRLKALLAFAAALNPEANGGSVNEDRAVAAAKEFASGDDSARVHRQLFVASRLLQRRVGLQTAYELTEAARNSVDAGMIVPELTLAIQADEFRSIRARAIAEGGTPSIPEAPRNVLSNLLRGRIEDTAGWALFNQDKLDEAAEHLKRAVTILPEGTPSSRAALWRLGATLERQDKKSEALGYYIKSYNSGELDPVRRSVIEQLYRKVNGSLDGLDEKIGPGATLSASAVTTTETEKPVSAEPEPTPAAVETPAASPSPESTLVAVPVPSPASSPLPETPAAAAPETTVPTPSPEEVREPSTEPTPEAGTEPTPEASPASSPSPDSTPAPESSPTATPEPAAPTTNPSLSSSPVEKMNQPVRSTITITGRVKDSAGAPLANVVVVLISPQGTVLASTTDEQGNYSFSVVPASSPRSFRIIPSKDGLAFDPLDRVVPLLSDDVKGLDFVARSK